MLGTRFETDDSLLAWEMRESAILRQMVMQMELPHLFVEQKHQRQKFLQQNICQLLLEKESNQLQQRQYIQYQQQQKQQQLLQQQLYQHVLRKEVQPESSRLLEQQTPQQGGQSLPQNGETKQLQTAAKQPQNQKLNRSKKRPPPQQQQQKQQQQKQGKRRKTGQLQPPPKPRMQLRTRSRTQRGEQTAKETTCKGNNPKVAMGTKAKHRFPKQQGLVDGLNDDDDKISPQEEDGYWIDNFVQEGVMAERMNVKKGNYHSVPVQNDEFSVDGYWV
mmetsp:Transcript_9600/g.22547  ORF Transcript_9600/g.22547 Transcript_9600/m.22547 type:complete len:275 (+) Transcript_9600:207-1031(+)|eukprot:CAMPEP_0113644186 /NCGR_PEP_ID=MMETSP0017_2-20120614/23250_1 /TAXON_ID=2856 /ORGANISM="Cylindrotheca closterium" /LENGTH=274 /DNA_ID=CAMNT_0000555773 /DNA_START=123 /DNA_END=947 /DNA_ORIENTATION=- /assembly_acc=CAM_ASM_000147